MNRLLLAALAFLAALVAAASAGDCHVGITQKLVNAWTSNGEDHSQWSVTITNTGSGAVMSLSLDMAGDFDQVWEMTEDNDGLYELPSYVTQNGGLAAGATHNFGYIIKCSEQATIDVDSVTCKGAAASSSPSASASPACSSSPSPSPSSPARSASPSSVVSSPQPSSQPSGCRVKVDQVARSAAMGGQWTQGDSTFIIYDLTISNPGGVPIDGATLTITTDDMIYQFWNLQRVDTSAVFHVPTPWGAIQPGGSQGAGYIVKYKTGSSPSAPTIQATASCSGGSSGSSPAASPSMVSSPQPSSQPSGCQAQMKMVARSASSGGYWQDGNTYNQIFDITITNTGNVPISGGEVAFNIPSGVTISQYWELNRKDGNHFDIPTTYGKIQVGASQGAGIVATATTAQVPVPSGVITSLLCN